LRTLRTPSLLLGVAAAALVLGLAGGSRPMFVSSAASEALRQDLDDGCRFAVGLRVQRGVGIVDPPPAGAAGTPQLGTATAALDEAVEGLAAPADAIVTIFGGEARLAGPEATGDGYLVALVARTAALDHVPVVDSGSGPGAWLPDIAADELGVGVGDEVELRLQRPTGDALVPVTVPVAGVIRDLRSVTRDAHWCSMESTIQDVSNPPPPVALLDADLMVDVLTDAGVPGTLVWWEHTPTGDDWDLPAARADIAALEQVGRRANNSADPLGRALGRGSTAVDVAGTVDHAERAAASVESAAGPVALGTAGLAVLVLVAAARTWLDRRRQELTMLALRGAGPGALAVKGVLELLGPVVLGGAVGMATAVAAVRVIGPGPQYERRAFLWAIALVVVTLAVALAAVAVVVAVGGRRVGVGAAGVASRSTLLRWEPAALVLAGAAFYELRTRGSSIVDDTEVDYLLMLFPVLLLAGGAGVLARVLLAPRPLAWATARLPTPAWLAARRLAAGRLRAAPVVTAAAVSIGVVVLAGALSSSLRATTHAKSTLGPGSEQVVRMSEPVTLAEVPPTLRDVSTIVTRTSERGVRVLGHDAADVLGVDPATFERAAFWDDSFAGRSLPDLLAALGGAAGGDAVPAVAVGSGLPDRFAITVPGEDGDVEIDVAAVERADAFPGYGVRQDRPLVVVDRDELARRGVLGPAEVWLDDASPSVAQELAAAGMPAASSTRPSESVEGSTLQTHLWAVDYLEVVGAAAGLVTIAGLGLYLAADARRRQLGTAVARRLGMAAWRGAAATAIEVVALLAAGLVLGVGLSWLAARLVVPELDPLPNSAPDPILRVDLAVVGLCAAGALATAVVVTAVVEARTARASLPRLLRDGE
jgi:putative ABC transport system permease protein